MDASVAAKWFLEEAGRPEAIGLLASWGGSVQMWAPELLWVEFANAVRHKVLANLIGPHDARRIMRTLLAMDIHALRLGELAGKALDLALETGVSVWDATYVATALRIGAELWTADRELAERGAAVLDDIHLLTWDQ